MKNIIIEISGKKINAVLNETHTSIKILDKLPISSTINRWGDEIYFTIPVESELENSVEFLEEGDIAYWPPGNAFCIFFGLTPASTDERPRAAGPVSIIGKLSNIEDIDSLRSFLSGQKIQLSKK